MTCNSCTENKLDLGCFGHCDTISQQFTPTQTGDHIIKYSFAGGINSFTVSATTGVPFQLSSSIFNEFARSFFTITQPDSTLFTITVNSIDYQCFSVDIRPEYTVS